jgi:molybdate transport system substrate-binding protein
MKRLLSSALFVAFALANPHGAHAQTELTLIAPGGIRTSIEALIPGFERKTGYKVKATFGSGGGTRKQVVQGEAFDVPVVQPPLQEVLASGNVVAGTQTPLASVSVGVAVRKGAPKPDISTPEAVKKMLLAAKSVAYPSAAGGAAAGVSFDETLKKLGIADQMQPKIKPAQGGAGAMAMAASGEVEIGLTFLSEMENPGIDIVGPLPREISPPTVLVGFVSTHAKDPAAAKTLLDYLSSPEAAAVYKAQGMQPGGK